MRKGNADAPIKDFVLNTLSGADTTNALLAAKGYSLLLFIKDDAGRGNWQGTFKKITDITAQKDIPAFIITNDIEDNTPYLKDINNLTWLRCDVVPIKTAARANPTLYLLYNGTIIDKWGFADFVNAAERINKINAR